MTTAHLDLPSLAGRVAVVTGTGGLGLETAMALAQRGAEVIVAGRNLAKGAQALDAIAARAPKARAAFEPVDLADLASVGRFAAWIAAQDRPLDILVNNAGVMSPPQRQVTAQGFELQFGVNYLAHFALTAGLLPALRRAAAPRVVSVTSLAQHYAKPAFDDLQSEHVYRPGRAYCLSKWAQAVFARELQRRSAAAGWGVASMAAHPGYAATGLFSSQKGADSLGARISAKIIAPLLGQSASAGALPILYAAAAPGAKPGRLYGPTGRFEMKGPPGECKYAKSAEDEALAARLWSLSEALAKLTYG